MGRFRVTSQTIIAKVPVVPGEPGFNFGSPIEQQQGVVLWAARLQTRDLSSVPGLAFLAGEALGLSLNFGKP